MENHIKNICLFEIFDEKSFDKIPAVELGLSADSMMASQLGELDEKAFLSNSDARRSKLRRNIKSF